MTEKQRIETPDTKPTTGFKAIMREAAATRSYAASLSVLNVAEWLYLDWAMKTPKPLPSNFVQAKWPRLRRLPPRWTSTVADSGSGQQGLLPAGGRARRAFFDAAYEGGGLTDGHLRPAEGRDRHRLAELR